MKHGGILLAILMPLTALLSMACSGTEFRHELGYTSIALGAGEEVDAEGVEATRTDGSSHTLFNLRADEVSLTASFGGRLDCVDVGDVIRTQRAVVSDDEDVYEGSLEADVVEIRDGMVHLEYFGMVYSRDDGEELEVMGQIRVEAEGREI